MLTVGSQQPAATTQNNHNIACEQLSTHVQIPQLFSKSTLLLYRSSARAVARFCACALQSRASGAHSLCDPYHDGRRPHLSPIMQPLCVLRWQEQLRATYSGRLIDSARWSRGPLQNCDNEAGQRTRPGRWVPVGLVLFIRNLTIASQYEAGIQFARRKTRQGL